MVTSCTCLDCKDQEKQKASKKTINTNLITTSWCLWQCTTKCSVAQPAVSSTDHNTRIYWNDMCGSHSKPYLHYVLHSVHTTRLKLGDWQWHCWLGSRQSVWPTKMVRWVIVWLSVLIKVQTVCTWSSSWCHCPPIISCFINIQNGSAFLKPASSGSLNVSSITV